jgi:hypothetical protein
LFLDRGRNLRIGGIDVVISAVPGCRLRIANPLYRPFVVKTVAKRVAPRIRLSLKTDRWPGHRHLAKMFDTQDSWSLYGDGERFWLSLSPPPPEEPLWLACFDRGLERVDLYCRAIPPKKSGPRMVDLPLVYPLDQLLLMYFLARRNGMLLHAAGLVRRGRVYLFAGASGAGKSTLSGLLAAAGAGKLLSDERMIVRETAGTMNAFGTPWAGMAGIARPGSAPAAGIYFLRHGRDNHMEKLPAAEALDRLLPLVSIPWYDPDTMSPIIAFAKHFLAHVPAYEMSFLPDSSASEFILQAVSHPS